MRIALFILFCFACTPVASASRAHGRERDDPVAGDVESATCAARTHPLTMCRAVIAEAARPKERTIKQWDWDLLMDIAREFKLFVPEELDDETVNIVRDALWKYMGTNRDRKQTREK